MEKRLVVFWLLTGLIFMFYFQYQARQRQALIAQQEAEAAANAENAQPTDGSQPGEGAQPSTGTQPGEEPQSGPATDTTSDPSATSSTPPAPNGEGTTTPAAEVDSIPSDPVVAAPTMPQHFVIGSLDTNSSYTMAVYLNNRGASVERIELNGSRDLEDRSGYLGYLAFDYAAAASVVNVVPPGSAASSATCQDKSVGTGIQVGDEIIRVNERPIGPPAEIDLALAATRPGEKVTLVVRRGGQELPFAAILGRRPLAIVQSQRGDSLPLGQNGPNSFLMSLAQVDQTATPFAKEELPGIPSLRDAFWNATAVDDHTIEFRHSLSEADMAKAQLTGAWEIVKRYRLVQLTDQGKADDKSGDPAATGSRHNYHIDLEIEFHNRDRNAHRVAWRLDSASGLPTEGWWYLFKTHPRNWGAAGARDVIYREPQGLHQMVTSPSIIKKASDSANPVETIGVASSQVAYVGVDTQYFVVAIQSGNTETPPSAAAIPVSKAIAKLAEPVDAKHKRIANTMCRIDGPLTEVPAGGTYKQAFRIFAGPKDREILEAYGLGDCIVYGWGIFAAVAQPMTRLLHGLYAVVGNFGIAIILLTVLVRGCMFPISRQQVASAKRMQELAPEMKRINEQFKSDMEGRAKAQRELLHKHNVNPLSGCLPGLLQLPIFIGLYRCLSVDIALRGAPFVPGIEWCSNLAAPDQLMNWSSFMPEFIAGPNGYLGPYLNVLPMISCGLFLVQQKLFTPPPTDEQQEMQHRMMSFMTLFMGVLFFKVPSGLCLYFISSSLWALAERKLLPKTVTPGNDGGSPNFKTSTTPTAPSGPRDANSIVTWLKSKQNGSVPEEESRDDRKKRRSRKR